VRVLFDHGTPVSLRRLLTKHDVITAHELGWSQLNNRELLDSAEREGFTVLVTTDANLESPQQWRRIQQNRCGYVAAVDGATPGSYFEVEVP
jgi:hypothetical protein